MVTDEKVRLAQVMPLGEAKARVRRPAASGARVTRRLGARGLFLGQLGRRQLFLRGGEMARWTMISYIYIYMYRYVGTR